MKKRGHHSAPESIDLVLDRAGENRFAKYRPPISARVWRDAVGPRIADRAEPVSLERGVLVVKVATSVWASELSLLCEPIMVRLRAKRIEVTELKFRVGVIEPLTKPPERRVSRAVPAPAALPPELALELKNVGDLDLRETIALAARANLAWQTHVAEPALSEGPRAARAPRSAETESDPRDRK